MAKWADYLISAVRYNTENTRIVKVELRKDTGDKAIDAGESTRSEIVSNIKQGTTYITIYKGNDGWKKGEDVRIKKVGENEFITTDPNETTRDNLGKLPEF